jgi:hypothetical protein
MSAPNPWSKDLEPLDHQGILVSEEDPLALIRNFILNWPGEETVKFDYQTRHNRLIQIIAGYPEIDVGRYPLDWPLSKKANDALRLTRYFDSIKSPDGKTSLRSVLLNQSRGTKHLETENEFGKAHRRMLSVLFLGVRHAENIIENSSLTLGEHKLLLVLHSNNQRRVSKFWPLKEMKAVLNNAENLDWSDMNYLPRVKPSHQGKVCDSWTDNRDLLIINRNDLISVKMGKIQSWISNWSDYNLENDVSFGATLLRGASAVLESVMSGLRASIIHNYGVESIVVDGGGRIEFMGDDESKGVLLESFYSIFSISPNKTPYFNYELEKVARIVSRKSINDKVSQSNYNLIYGIPEKVKHKSIIRDKRKEWILQHLPRLSIAKIDDLPTGGEEFHPLKHNDCCICNPNLDLKEVDIKGGRDSKMSDSKYPVCNFHRLLYFVGKAQRMVNSTTKRLGIPLDLNLNSQREVIAISRLDLNSLGILFTSKFEEGKDNCSDLRMRRSIRFNSQWWDIIRSSLDLDCLDFDRIVPWVAAGDDITLADYVPTGSQKSTHLFDILKNIASKLNHLSDTEYNPFKLSYGAGVSFRGKKNISQMMNESHKSEVKAKNLWKERMSREFRFMVTKQDGQIKEFDSAALCDLHSSEKWYDDCIIVYSRVGIDFIAP